MSAEENRESPRPVPALPGGENDAVNYRTVERTVHHRDGFDVVMDDEQVVFEFHEHYQDEVSARAAVRDYIEEWEFQADLSIGAGNFRLEFIRAEIVDRDPVLGDRHVPSWVTMASIRISAIPAVVDYPVPPAKTTVDPEDTLFAAMRQRYEAYSRDSAALTAVAYFCLTCLEQTVPEGQSRKAAAALYDIPYRDLQQVGALADRKGGQQGARKAKAIENDLTDEETAFLVDMVKLMIRRRGEVAALPHDGGPTVSPQKATGRSATSPAGTRSAP